MVEEGTLGSSNGLKLEKLYFAAIDNTKMVSLPYGGTKGVGALVLQLN